MWGDVITNALFLFAGGMVIWIWDRAGDKPAVAQPQPPATTAATELVTARLACDLDSMCIELPAILVPSGQDSHLVLNLVLRPLADGQDQSARVATTGNERPWWEEVTRS